MSARFLRLTNGDKFIYPWTEALASRPDMVECDQKGNVLAQQPIPAAPPAYSAPKIQPDTPPQPVGISDSPDNVPAAAPPPAGPSSGHVDMSEPQISAEEAEKRAKRKADLIKFAKDRFNITIDPEESLAVIEKKLAKKLKTATVPENLEG